MSETSVEFKMALGQIEDIPISKVTGLQDILNNIENPSDPYVHPTQPVIDSSELSGGSVISRIKVNELGHTEIVSTRTLTPQSIGAQPAGSYEVISNKDTSTSLGNSNEKYPTQRAVKTYVDNIVSPKANSAITLTAGSGLTGGGNLTANRSFAVDNTVLRTNNTTQTKTGLFRLRRGSSSSGIELQGWDYPDNNGEDYNFRLFSNGTGNNVKYYFRQKSIAGSNDVILNFPVLGFRNGVTIIGGDDYPTPDLEIEDYYNLQTNPATRHPLRLYVAGQSQFKETIVVGTTLKKTQAFGSDTTIYNEGSIILGAGGSNTYRTISLNTPGPTNAYIALPNYSAYNIYNSRTSNGHYFSSEGINIAAIAGGGIATTAPGGTAGSLGPWIRFGEPSVNSSNTVDTVIRIQIGPRLYDLLAREVNEF